MTRSGIIFQKVFISRRSLVLIPLLVDDPLWGFNAAIDCATDDFVLIPLLVDDPLWVLA